MKKQPTAPARKEPVLEPVMQMSMTMMTLCALTLFGVGQAAVLGVQGNLLGSGNTGFSTLRTSSQVVSADAKVRTPQEHAGVLKASAPTVQSITIIEPDGSTGWYMPWDKIELKAVATYDNGETADVDASWVAREWYGKQNAYTIPKCSATAHCVIFHTLRYTRFDVTASYAGMTSSPVHVGYSADFSTSELPRFTDGLPDWAADDIRNVASTGIMNGYRDGRFGANDTVTNAQFAIMLTRLAKLTQESDDSNACPTAVALPAGMTPGNFAYPAYCFFVANGHNTNWVLKLHEPVTRLDAAMMVNDVIGGSHGFADMGAQRGNDTLEPSDPVNRAEAAMIMMRTLRLVLQQQ